MSSMIQKPFRLLNFYISLRSGFVLSYINHRFFCNNHDSVMENKCAISNSQNQIKSIVFITNLIKIGFYNMLRLPLTPDKIPLEVIAR